MLLVVLLFVVVGVAHAQDCLLVVPPNPLTAAGLATPYILESVDPKNPCHQTDNGASFVQGAVVDIETGNLFVYNPLVIDKGTTPATPPVVPTLPAYYVVGLWFGTNGDSLTLVDANGSLSDGQCVDGIPGSIFGQYSYCNAPLFFFVVNSLISVGKINVPKLGTALDGQPCPTTRSFFIVDQDQSDNVVTSYLITTNNKLAQNTAKNRKTFHNTTVLDNGSDEGLVVLVNAGLGCASWDVPDLADPGASLASLPMNEIMAAAREPAPVALVPAGDPMVVLADGSFNLTKVNAYRIGVDQRPASSLAHADTTTYCRHLEYIFPTRMMNNITRRLLSAQPSPDPALANTLYTFLAARFNASLINLNCATLLGSKANVLTLTTDSEDCVINAEVNAAAIPADSWSSSEGSDEGVHSSAHCVMQWSTVTIIFLMVLVELILL